MTGFKPLVNRGTMVISGHEFTVNQIRLRNSRFEITAIGRGPLAAVKNEPATIYGEDGKGVLQGGVLNVPEVADGEPITVTVTFQVTMVIS